MVNDFNGFGKGVIGKKLPSDTTLNNMKKADLIKLLHTAQHNYETLNWFYNNAVNANMSQLNNNGWILCSERLPEDGQDIIVTTEDGRTDFGWYEANKNWCVNDAYFPNAFRFIAWQPKPESYKPKESEKK